MSNNAFLWSVYKFVFSVYHIAPLEFAKQRWSYFEFEPKPTNTWLTGTSREWDRSPDAKRYKWTLSTNYALPRLQTKFGERAFSHAGPSAWNALPEDIRATSDSVVFRRQLKTHYFSLAFNTF